MQGEVELVLDLVANVEDGQHLAVAQVPPPKNTLPGLTAQRALLVQAKQIQLRVRTPLKHPTAFLGPCAACSPYLALPWPVALQRALPYLSS